MPVKRPVDDDDDGSGNGQLHPHMPAVKASRHDLQQHQQQQHQHQDYDAHHQQHAAQQQASARKKGVSNRTGQACDRCKVREYYSFIQCYVMSCIQYAHTHAYIHL